MKSLDRAIKMLDESGHSVKWYKDVGDRYYYQNAKNDWKQAYKLLMTMLKQADNDNSLNASEKNEIERYYDSLLRKKL